MPRTLEPLGQLWTPSDVAERYGLSQQTLANWRSLGVGPPSIKVGRKVRYRERDLALWENDRRQRA